MRTLFKGGTIHTLTRERADWLLVEEGSIAGAGTEGDAPEAGEVVDLDGGTLVPGFCDAHVHLPATGLQASGLDLRGVENAEAVTAALAERVTQGPAALYAANLEERLDGLITRHILDRVAGPRAVLVARADLHSCVVSTTLLDQIDLGKLEGVEREPDGNPTGRLREKAAAEAWRWFDSSLPPAEIRSAVQAAVDLAYSKGVTSAHEMYVVEWRGWSPLEALKEVVGPAALNVPIYIASEDVGRVRSFEEGRIGGDWFLDGSFGSYTAWMSDGYAVAIPPEVPSSGVRYRSDEKVLELFEAAQSAGLQMGVHVIGDAAIDQAVRCWEQVAERHGIDAVRRLRHRLEHFECASDAVIKRSAHLGLTASVQPVFDRFWGGPDGMYAARLGWERASRMNRFASMLDASMRLGAGSDSTVTPLDPFLGMAALRGHHVEAERVSPEAALTMHTLGGHALAMQEDLRGTIERGKRADLALLDRDPLAVDADELLATEVMGTWCEGKRVWPKHEAA